MRTPTTRRTATATAAAMAVPLLLAGLAPAGFVAAPDHAVSSTVTRAEAPATTGSQDPSSDPAAREHDGDDADEEAAHGERAPAPESEPGDETTRGDGDTARRDEPDHAGGETDGDDSAEHADGDGGTPQPDVEASGGERAQEASRATEQEAGCEPFVVHTPTSSEGATHAVAITSQTLAQGRRGWERVAWEASSRAGITGVLLVREDGVEHLDDGDLRAGSAESVLEIGFCGDPGPGAPEPDRPSAETPPTGSSVPVDDTEARTEAGTGDGGGEETRPGSGGGSGEGSREVEVLGVQLEGERPATAAGSGDAAGDGALARTGAEVPRLAAGGLLGLLLGTAVLLGGRHLRSSAPGAGTDHPSHAPGAGRAPRRGRA